MKRDHKTDVQVNGAFAFILNGPKVDIIPLYRGVTEGPELYFQEGFSAKGSNSSLLEHVLAAKDSAFVSTSKSLNAGKFFGEKNSGGKKIFVYEINRQNFGVDIFEKFSQDLQSGKISDPNAMHFITNESEVAVPERIYPKDIKGVRIYDADPINSKIVPGSENYVHNPNYVPPPLSKVAQQLQTGIKIAGRTGITVGAAVDTTNLCFAFYEGLETDDYQHFFNEGARILGGWTGALTLGTACGAKGALWCIPFGPGAQLVGGAACGLAGSIAGYLAGGEIAQFVSSNQRRRFFRDNILRYFFQCAC